MSLAVERGLEQHLAVDADVLLDQPVHELRVRQLRNGQEHMTAGGLSVGGTKAERQLWSGGSDLAERGGGL